MPAPVLQFKRGNAGVAGTVPALRPGEPAISLNNFDFFIGIDASVANNKFFGSHRYWGREDGINSLRLKLVDKDGTNYVAIKTPNTLAGNVTYVLPGTQGASNTVLTNDGSGNLVWGSGSSNPTFSGISTFIDTTDNTLGNPNTGAVQIDGGVGIAKNLTVGAGLSVAGQSYFIGTATFYGGQINLGDSDGDNISVAGEFISNLVPNATNTYDLGLTAKRWRNAFYSGNVDIAGITTIGSGVGITQFSSSVSTGSSTSSVPTSSAVIDYVSSQIGNVDSTLGINADSGGPSSVTTSQTLTIGGTASEIETSVSGQTITVGLPDAVVVGTSLSAPTIRTGTIQSSNTGATAITIAANDVTIADDLTVQGNLYVNGNTTQVNTTALTVEDRTIELGVVDGAAPSTTTTWDLGVLFNYNSSGAKKSAVIWEQGDTRFKFASVIGSDTNGSDANTPQLSVTTFAPIEIAELWVNNSCTGGSSQVIACSGSDLVLQNILVDAGTF